MSRCSSPTDFTLHMVDYLHGKDFARRDIAISDGSDTVAEDEAPPPTNAYEDLANKSVIVDSTLQIPTSLTELSDLAKALHAKCLQLQGNCAELNATIQLEKQKRDEEVAAHERRRLEAEDTVAKRDGTIETYITLIHTERERHAQEIEQLEDLLEKERHQHKESSNDPIVSRRQTELEAAMRSQQIKLEAAVRQLGDSLTKNKELEEAAENTDAELLRLHGSHDLAEKQIEELEAKLQAAETQHAATAQYKVNDKKRTEEEVARLQEEVRATETRRQNMEQKLRQSLSYQQQLLVEVEDAQQATAKKQSEIEKLQWRERQATETQNQEQKVQEDRWNLRLSRLNQEIKLRDEQVDAANVQIVSLARELEESKAECKIRGKILMHEWGKQECGTARAGDRQRYQYRS